MESNPENLALAAFRRAAERVPAYRTLLEEAGTQPSQVKTAEDFRRLPILEKRTTFGRFSLAQLCVDGAVGQPASVLTSSGHSGLFAFGLTDREAVAATAEELDDLFDLLFAVRTQPTLLVNGLPMGVKVPTRACTLAETSVRADMIVTLVKNFAPHFRQIILVGEAAFLKHVLELGQSAGIDWPKYRIHVVVGEEPLAENARKYLLSILGRDVRRPEEGMIVSSFGIAELGLNLFAEVPPVAPLILLRRALHENPGLRKEILGDTDFVPSLFTYDPHRIFVEFDHNGRLLLTTLNPHLRIPLIRYASGDRGRFFKLPDSVRPAVEAAGISWETLQELPLAAIQGRGDHALAGTGAVYPEAVKEGIYHDSALARQITANFRLASGADRARIRIQLAPHVARTSELEIKFTEAIARYVRHPIEVSCEPYENFRSGMALDFERKFNYLGT